ERQFLLAISERRYARLETSQRHGIHAASGVWGLERAGDAAGNARHDGNDFCANRRVGDDDNHQCGEKRCVYGASAIGGREGRRRGADFLERQLRNAPAWRTPRAERKICGGWCTGIENRLRRMECEGGSGGQACVEVGGKEVKRRV